MINKDLFIKGSIENNLYRRNYSGIGQKNKIEEQKIEKEINTVIPKKKILTEKEIENKKNESEELQNWIERDRIKRQQHSHVPKEHREYNSMGGFTDTRSDREYDADGQRRPFD